jgi:hypothetical protein
LRSQEIHALCRGLQGAPLDPGCRIGSGPGIFLGAGDGDLHNAERLLVGFAESLFMQPSMPIFFSTLTFDAHPEFIRNAT